MSVARPRVTNMYLPESDVRPRFWGSLSEGNSVKLCATRASQKACEKRGSGVNLALLLIRSRSRSFDRVLSISRTVSHRLLSNAAKGNNWSGCRVVESISANSSPAAGRC